MESCPLTSGHDVARHFHLPVLIAFWVICPLPPAGSLYLHREEYATNQDDTESTAADMQPTLSWAVKFRVSSHRRVVQRTDYDEAAQRFAADVHLLNHGQVGELLNHYLFVHPSYNQTLRGSDERTSLGEIQEETERLLRGHPDVEWFHQQRIRRRTKRGLKFNDPSYSMQWHLHNHKSKGMDINVTEVWQHNITGMGVVVAVIDDGLEWRNEDLLDNYNAKGSWDLNSNDPDPMPEVHKGDGKSLNRHGTRCAGEIAAVANDKCSVGVAHNAQISGIRLLDGPMTDSLEATAFNKNMHINDIYSCSWGPDDDGKTVDGPHPLAQQALKHGVTAGRKGLGSIFVVASGNGGRNEDNCNYDGYANSMYTVTIGAVDESGQMPYYAEQCASMLAVTFSSGAANKRNIVTTDWTLAKGTGCTSSHTGTSAAAPLAAGMIALMIQAKPCLTWRDVQHIIIYTAIKVDEKNAVWITNAAGFHHSHKHGFGLMTAWRLVNAAKSWHTVPWLTAIDGNLKVVSLPILAGKAVTALQTVSQEIAENFEVTSLEHVLVTVSLSHVKRGKLEIRLICPSGTESVIGARRKKDDSSDGLKSWTFSSVRCWGESPIGDWKLVITDNHESQDLSTNKGTLQAWKLTLYGSSMNRSDIEKRKILVSEAMSGIFLDANMSEPCSYYLNSGYEEENRISAKAMEILLYISGVFTLMAVYYTVEQALCNSEDKEKQKEEEEEGDDEAPAREGGLQDRHERGDGEERTHLLEDVRLSLLSEDDGGGGSSGCPEAPALARGGKGGSRGRPAAAFRSIGEESLPGQLRDSCRRIPGTAVLLQRDEGDGDSDHALPLSCLADQQEAAPHRASCEVAPHVASHEVAPHGASREVLSHSASREVTPHDASRKVAPHAASREVAPHSASCEVAPQGASHVADTDIRRDAPPPPSLPRPVTFEPASVAQTRCAGCREKTNQVQYKPLRGVRGVDPSNVPASEEMPFQHAMPFPREIHSSSRGGAGTPSITRGAGSPLTDAPSLCLNCECPGTTRATLSADSTDLQARVEPPCGSVAAAPPSAAPSAPDQTRASAAGCSSVAAADRPLGRPITGGLLPSAAGATDRPPVSRDLIGPFEHVRSREESPDASQGPLQAHLLQRLPHI